MNYEKQWIICCCLLLALEGDRIYIGLWMANENQ